MQQAHTVFDFSSNWKKDDQLILPECVTDDYQVLKKKKVEDLIVIGFSVSSSLLLLPASLLTRSSVVVTRSCREPLHNSENKNHYLMIILAAKHI